MNASTNNDAAELDDLIIDCVINGTFDVHQTAHALGITRIALIRWLDVPEHARLVETALRANDLSVRSFRSKMQRSALATLTDLTKNTEKPDVARRACVDVLHCAPGSRSALDAERLAAMMAKSQRIADHDADDDHAPMPVDEKTHEQVQTYLETLVDPLAGDSIPDAPIAPRSCAITLRREPLIVSRRESG